MMRTTFSTRRVLLQAVAGLVLAASPVFAFGAAKDRDAPEKTPSDKDNGKNKESSAKGAAAKSKGAELTVLVTGNGKPIRQAEVRVAFPSSAGGESKRPTDGAGEATFKAGKPGTVKVRVIASGWESALREVVLKEGSQRVTINLSSLPEGK